ncbi:MAG TPA: hypothetical protein VEC12_04545 [Bacteroidia bacterium]|nr:hypothetical protein [Bacteroidia bacterium]
MTTQLFKIAVAGCLVILFSCKPGTVEPPKPPTPPAPGECMYTGKIEKVICGDGVWYDYWIRLDNGELLRPCKSEVAVPDKSQVYDGMPVEVDYYAVRGQCVSGMICKALPPQHTVANLTCFKTRVNH